jgi:hypothetical protein
MSEFRKVTDPVVATLDLIDTAKTQGILETPKPATPFDWGK